MTRCGDNLLMTLIVPESLPGDLVTLPCAIDSAFYAVVNPAMFV